MARERIELTPGERITTKLDKSESKPIDGRNGTDYMRICDDDQRIMFAPGPLELAIQESGATAGDIIEITSTGKGKNVRWEVAIVTETLQPARPAAVARPATQPAAQPRQQPAAAAQPVRQVNSEAVEMAEAFHAAIEAHKAAEEYAAAAGVPMRFLSPDAVRATATTIYIGRQKGSR